MMLEVFGEDPRDTEGVLDQRAESLAAAEAAVLEQTVGGLQVLVQDEVALPMTSAMPMCG